MNSDMVWIAVIVASVAVATLGIVIACLIYDYHRAKLGKPDPDAVPHVDEETRAELASLRGRVATLERLVTDDDRRIADEIQKLRREETQPYAGT